MDTIILGRGGGSLEELWSFNEEIVARAIFESNIPIISAVGHETDFTICDFVADMRAPTPSAAAELATPSLEEINYKLENILNRMNKSLINISKVNEYKLKHTFENIHKQLEAYIIRDKIIQLDKIYDKINFEVENNISLEKEKLSKLGAILHNLSPLATIDRGYSIVQKNKQVINSISDIEFKDCLDITLKDGNIECIVEKIKNKEV
ncbi:Exodeoxyribonuclease 7 large subunit [bioreactor metagenome]|uniref:Exodeoxyribonuclease 7 large subunit n=1 Tax=bioreactor metagenome TaxID=1076179 RepID=A0A645CKR4_9ZZZZ